MGLCKGNGETVMIVYSVMMFVVAAALIVFGVLIAKGNANLINCYREERVKDKNLYCKKISQALFSGTGGLFVMETMGSGKILINSFGSIEKIQLENEVLTVDNENVVAWDTNLHYDIHD